jgi:tRNA-(ms[2]io[6]A)-hydroxylase
MLGLKLPTDPRWVGLAEMSLEDILTDHAYCEMKAATACISLIQQYPEKSRLVKELSPVVTEEWGHFRMVIREMNRRGLDFGRPRKDEYVNQLMGFMEKPGDRDARLVERLLVCALIEARSCERFRLLSLELEDKSLQDFYHQFMIAEANHYRMFLDLAKHYGEDSKAVLGRWQAYLDFEKAMLPQLELRGDRMH